MTIQNPLLGAARRLTLIPGRVRPFVGESPAVQDLLEKADRLAATDLSLLIRGESGVGKDVLTRRIHDASPRARGPLRIENAAAIPETLMESTFFGHVRGAFTGAVRGQDGALVQADGGTLFLDEVGDMPLSLQAKLLRVLEDGMVRPVGSSTARKVDVRVIGATNKDLSRLVREGRFREDLYFRLNGATLEIPPLRERMEDLPALARHFLAELDARHETSRVLSGELLDDFQRHDWPGNARELCNVVTLHYWLCEGERLEPGDWSRGLRGEARGSGFGAVKELKPLAELERDAIHLALRESGGDRRRAAKSLGISRSSFYERLKRHGLAVVSKGPRLAPA